MKKIISVLLALALLFSLSVCAFAAGETTTDASAQTDEIEETGGGELEESNDDFTGVVVLLYTGGAQGSLEGYAKVAAAKTAIAQTGASVVLADTGNFLGDSDHDMIFTLLEAANYDAVVLGSNERTAELSALSVPVISVNLTADGEPIVQTSLTVEGSEGVLLGLIGVTPATAADAKAADSPETPDTDSDSSDEEADQSAQETVLTGEALTEAIEAQAEALREAGCTYIVCMGAEELDTPSVDLYITGQPGELGIVVLDTEGGTAAQTLTFSQIAIEDDKIAALLAAAAAPEETETPISEIFADVLDGAWYTDAVAYVYANGIMNGLSTGYFGLDGEVSRQQLATILYRLSGSPETSGNLSAFSDGESVADWAYDAMVWAVSQGILNGTDTGLEPAKSATRQEVATILYRFCKASGGEDVDLSLYSDAAQIDAWAADAMGWAVAAGMISGDDQGALSPTAPMTRAAIANALWVLSSMETDAVN